MSATLFSSLGTYCAELRGWAANVSLETPDTISRATRLGGTLRLNSKMFILFRYRSLVSVNTIETLLMNIH